MAKVTTRALIPSVLMSHLFVCNLIDPLGVQADRSTTEIDGCILCLVGYAHNSIDFSLNHLSLAVHFS